MGPPRAERACAWKTPAGRCAPEKQPTADVIYELAV
jgi:hypothetical protein